MDGTLSAGWKVTVSKQSKLALPPLVVTINRMALPPLVVTINRMALPPLCVTINRMALPPLSVTFYCVHCTTSDTYIGTSETKYIYY
jgi:hypothetical protein